MTDTMTTVRSATSADVPMVVDTHLRSFEGFFLSSLGPRFLKTFYEGVLDVESGILLVAVRDGEVIGFVGGSTEQVGFYGELLRTRRAPFIRAAAGAALRHPATIRRLVRARRRASGDDQTPAGPCLMTLGVLPRAEGRGAGRQLVAAFERELRQRGANRVALTTDAVDNDRTNRFYTGLGFVLSRVIVTPEGRHLNEYTKAISH